MEAKLAVDHSGGVKTSSALLRNVQKRDNAAVANIIRDVLTQMGCTGEGIAIRDPEVDAIFETYSLPRSAYFVVEHEGVVVGGGGVAPLKGGQADVCELQKWYLLPQYQGFGYGRMLFDAMMASARSLGFCICYVETFEHMEQAAKFYKQSGFSILEKPMGSTGHFACNRWYVKEL
jgi:putative acetyltransferase